MKIFDNDSYNLSMNYPIEQFGEPEKILFFDIETTGLSAKTASVYMIGCCYYNGNKWVLKQWFASTPEEEAEILNAFSDFTESFEVLIHFNGNKFDIPFINERLELHDLFIPFDNFIGVDIYRRVFPFRHFLKLSNCKQKTLEEFLGIQREDVYSGGELIAVYKEYCENPTDEALSFLLQHNADDLAGMVSILPIFSFIDFLQDDFVVKKVQLNTYNDVNAEKRRELLITFTFPTKLPHSISYHANDCYFSAKENEGILKVPVYTEEMRYFYEDYNSYYYLPEEDVAIHKSVASFVDPAFRENATAATCYTRKVSNYLPQWDYIFAPFFKREYQSKNLFFELTDEFKTDREAFSTYASHILSMMVKIH